MKLTKTLIIAFFLFISFANAQQTEKRFSIGVHASYLTTSKLYLAPFSSDRFIRNTFIRYDDFYSQSIDFRYRLNKELLLGISVERINVTHEGRNITVLILENLNTETININDGYEVYPVELTLHYIFPFSTESFIFFMGGGIGYYHANHLRSFGNVSVYNVKRQFAYGIHVSTSMEYFINDNFSVKGDIKFRDPQFTLETGYEKTTVKYGNRDVMLLQETFDSKINIDGVSFSIGLAFHF